MAATVSASRKQQVQATVTVVVVGKGGQDLFDLSLSSNVTVVGGKEYAVTNNLVLHCKNCADQILTLGPFLFADQLEQIGEQAMSHRC